MSLWCMMRSPLMIGGEMNKNDDFTLGLLTNDSLLEIEKAAFCAHPLRTTEEESVWIALRKDGKGCYVAFFNLSDQPRKVEMVDGEMETDWHEATEVWTGMTKTPGQVLGMDLQPHDAAVFRII